MLNKAQYKIFIGVSCAFSCLTALAGQKSYIGKWIPDITQCKIVESSLLYGGGDSYLIAKCDMKTTDERSIRIWRARSIPNRPSKMFDEIIYGEAILPWQNVTGTHSYGTSNSYWLLNCREKGKDKFEAAGFVKVGATKATSRNALLYFKQGKADSIDVVPFSKIAECEIPEC